jgi:hypothetical protein
MKMLRKRQPLFKNNFFVNDFIVIPWMLQFFLLSEIYVIEVPVAGRPLFKKKKEKI